MVICAYLGLDSVMAITGSGETWREAIPKFESQEKFGVTQPEHLPGRTH